MAAVEQLINADTAGRKDVTQVSATEVVQTTPKGLPVQVQESGSPIQTFMQQVVGSFRTKFPGSTGLSLNGIYTDGTFIGSIQAPVNGRVEITSGKFPILRLIDVV